MRFDRVLILDFGSQYTQLIARRIRELGVFSEILPYNASLGEIRRLKPCGIILSGGPSSVYEAASPRCGREILELGVPVMGICYGMQLISFFLGGRVGPSARREYGAARLKLVKESELFKGLGPSFPVWMSHGDEVKVAPVGFEVTAVTENALGAVEDRARGIYGLQFHPEVVHTPDGKRILDNFVRGICGCRADYSAASFIEEAVERIRQQVGAGKAICALSGGVDSAVAAALTGRAIGERLICIFVDNGLLRKNEFENVLRTFSEYGQLQVKGVAAGERFLTALKGVVDPEEKRQIIGRVFVEVFQQEAAALEGVEFLVQGTLYPDVIESRSVKGPSAVIKSHHNVGGLPAGMNLRLVEPLRELFKDEVREVGRQLHLPEAFISRHPFPGPGLAVRILGEVNQERIRLLQEADSIVQEEIAASGWYERLWQVFAVLLPVRTVGVMGDERTYEQVVAIRAVESQDGMTADWARLPYEVLERISRRVVSEVRGVNRVVYDLSSKPPGTIEWE